jgi:AraC-like DNA-binding protein
MASSTLAEPLPVISQHYVPRGPLSEFVGLFWYYRGHDVEYSKERILPMPNTGLVIFLGRGPAAAGISGPQSESFIIERRSMDEILGIHFKPGGAFPFLDFPLGELHGQHLGLEDVWGAREASELICRLHEARTIEKKFQLLEAWLTGIAVHRLKHHPAVAFALREFDQDSGLISSAVMAERVGFSQRRFIELFRNEIGLTPKLYCRVQRFQNVITRVEKLKSVDWVDVALSCGYFDQSHFNHDFREFSGLSPTEYMELRTGHHSHVQVRH